MDKDKLLKIINEYGIMKQLKYFQSEVFELNEAIIKQENKDVLLGCVESINKLGTELFGGTYMSESVRHIAEEIADVQVMLNQFKEYYKIDDKQIESVMDLKINRQLERIEGEKNDN